MCDGICTPQKLASHKRQKVPARRILDYNGTYRYSLMRSDNRAEATLKRAERAIAALGKRKQFLIVYYGTDGSGGWQKISRPLRTITTVDRFAYVHRNGSRRYEMRMLQVPELKKAMGFPTQYRLEHGTRRDKIKLLGNAVCPPVMEAIIRGLLPTNIPRKPKHARAKNRKATL